MFHLDPRTLQQRVQCVSRMISERKYGAVTKLSQNLDVCRQTRYNWADLGRQALEQIFQPSLPPTNRPDQLERQILTLLVEGHASYRGIQASLRCFGHEISLGSIAAIIKRATQRAQIWLERHAHTSRRSIALDEIFGRQRCGAYLSVVDATSMGSVGSRWTVGSR